MTDVVGLEEILVLILAALVPAVVYLAWVRRTEGGEREGWNTILNAFGWGALFATFVAAIVEAILIAVGTSVSQAVPAPEFVFFNGNTTAGAFFLILVIAPFVEEGFKALGVVNYRTKIANLADGPVIGASVGLGFGFFETFLYGLAAYFTGGLLAGLSLIILRSFSSVLLHGSSTAFFGYGYAEAKVSGGGNAAGTHYLGAVGLHSAFNGVVSLGVFATAFHLEAPLPDALSIVGFAAGILLAFAAIEYVRRLIVQASYPGALALHPKFRPPPVRRVPGVPARPNRYR
jgi:RsiW-degrading membrane proteinase PrsW (M82 family)